METNEARKEPGVAAWLEPGEGGSHLSPLDSPGHLFGWLSQRWSRQFNRECSAQLGLRAPETKLLLVLDLRGPLPHRALVEISNMDKAQVSRTVAQLRDGGLIELVGKNRDSERFSGDTKARLTRAGAKLVDRATQIGRQHQLGILMELTQKERSILYDVLHRLIALEKRTS